MQSKDSLGRVMDPASFIISLRIETYYVSNKLLYGHFSITESSLRVKIPP